ncbi:MAG: class I SAM-dependent methyltransferase [Nitrospinaceae bacterium]|nr:class I SAM-dependent methyltransferase [Nitrospinaceae bacterium]MBT5369747.1 class I SAM-dependent methyltransferase [Nitrospinaceae bacterium]MBT6395744.1 class I SAM-dependent methyltransferase [Nitrospinaceae bacterium]
MNIFKSGLIEHKISFGSIFSRYAWISSIKNWKNPKLFRLNNEMIHFYTETALEQNYFEKSEQGNLNWMDGNHPFQEYISKMVELGNRVVEFSSGSGYAAKTFRDVGARYIGFDLNRSALGNTKKANRKDNLIVGDGYQAPISSDSSDYVVSFYALEHMVWPQRYIDEMIRVLKPGGIIALAFPDYVANWKRPMGSVREGRSSGGIQEKIKKNLWIDVVQSFIERKTINRYLRWKLHRNIYSKSQFRFLINLKPVCLVSDYRSDNDAVYFASEEEVARYLEGKNCIIEKRSGGIKGKNGENLDSAKSGNGFVVARLRTE